MSKTFGKILIGSLLVERKANIGNRYNKYQSDPTPYGKVAKTQDNSTHKRAKRSAFPSR